MPRSCLFTAIAFASVMTLACSFSEAGDPAEKARVLMLTQSEGFQHSSVTRQQGQLSPAEVAMVQLGQQSGLFEVHCTQDAAADFTKENLQNYDIAAFYTTGELPIAEEDREYFINDWLKQPGHGFIGFHSATDTYRSAANNEEQNERFRWYWEMIGGTFNGHPWTSRSLVTISVHDTDHPAMAPFGQEFQIRDEIYQYRNWQPEKVHVLMSLNMAECEPTKPYHVPVAWAKNWGDGKVFVNNLGHNETTWTDQRFLDSTLGAIRWMIGLESADATPNPEVSAREDRKAEAAHERRE